MHRYLLCGWPTDENNPDKAAYRVRKDELSTQSGSILWGSHVVIPNQARKQVLSELHVAHLGISRMKALARSYVWRLGWILTLNVW